MIKNKLKLLGHVALTTYLSPPYDISSGALRALHSELTSLISDQWSPINQDGKKQYDRDFLMKLQSDPLSKERPPNLPNLDIVKDKSIAGIISTPSKDWLPTFVKPTLSRVSFQSLS